MKMEKQDQKHSPGVGCVNAGKKNAGNISSSRPDQFFLGWHLSKQIKMGKS